MLNSISQTSNSGYARAVKPSHEGSLRAEKPPEMAHVSGSDSQQQAEEARSRQRLDKLMREERVLERRENQRDEIRDRANDEPPVYSPKNTESQASQLSDKLLESIQQSRHERMQAERAENIVNRVDRHKQVERAYHTPSQKSSSVFVDELA